MRTSREVRVWDPKRQKGRQKRPFRVRWLVAGREFNKWFETKPAAKNEYNRLYQAATERKEFCTDTGRIAEEVLAEQKQAKEAEHLEKEQARQIGTLDLAMEFVDRKWEENIAATYRKTLSETLMWMIFAQLPPCPAWVDEVKLRSSIRVFALNPMLRTGALPSVQKIIDWARDNSPPVSRFEEEDYVADVLGKMRTKFDGKPRGKWCRKRARAGLNSFLDFAVQQGRLTANHTGKVKDKRVPHNRAIDKRSVLNKKQAVKLLEAVENNGPSGPRLKAFYATMYFAGLRPEEVVALRVGDVELPATDDEWGTLHIAKAAPLVGKQWTDSGKLRDDKGLKGREEGEVRPVPCSPPLVKILRQHKKSGLTGGANALALMIPGEKDGTLSESAIRRYWREARKHVFTSDEFNSPMGKRVYDLRHSCVTMWLNAGVPVATVAEWAGHSVQVLFEIYAKCMSDQDDVYKQRIQNELDN